MQGLLLKLSLVASAAVGALASADAVPEDVHVAVTLPVECDRKTVNGDDIEVHYRGSLQATGAQFDASYDRGQPLSFRLGAGRVIKGWEEGLLDMCIGEKRTLTIPPHKAYGKRSIGPIPADSTLVFETELVAVKGVPKPESIVTKSTSAPAAESETASASGVAGKIAEKVGDAAKVAETVLADTDSDGQEHNEL